MKGLALVAVALAVAGLACTLGGGGAEGTISETGIPEGGVPMTKATPTPPGEGPAAATPTEQPPAPPQPTGLPAQPTNPPGPRPTTPPNQKPGVEVLDINVVGREDSFSAIGIVKNTTGSDLYAVWFTVDFLDAQGTIVSQERGNTDLHLLPAGGISSFEILFPQGVPPNPDAIMVLLEWREKTAGDEWTREGFEIVSSDGAMGESSYEITGEVRNSASLRAPSITLVAIAFNADGRLIGRSLGTVQDLGGGTTAPFSIKIPLLAEPNVARFEILVEGYRR